MNTAQNYTRRMNKLKKLMSTGTAQRKLTGFRWANTAGKNLTTTRFFNYRNKEGKLLNRNNNFTPIDPVPIPKEPRQFIPARMPNTRKSKYNVEISKLYAQISAMTDNYNEMIRIVEKSRMPIQVKEKLMMKINSDFYNVNEPMNYANSYSAYPPLYSRRRYYNTI
jgi:hypothetical protein